jgi:hypothetical protein
MCYASFEQLQADDVAGIRAMYQRVQQGVGLADSGDENVVGPSVY